MSTSRFDAILRPSLTFRVRRVPALTRRVSEGSANHALNSQMISTNGGVFALYGPTPVRFFSSDWTGKIWLGGVLNLTFTLSERLPG